MVRNIIREDPDKSENDRVYSEVWAAEFLHLSRRTLQNLRSVGGGPVFVKLGERRIGYTLGALRKWVASRSVTSTADATVREIGGMK